MVYRWSALNRCTTLKGKKSSFKNKRFMISFIQMLTILLTLRVESKADPFHPFYRHLMGDATALNNLEEQVTEDIVNHLSTQFYFKCF